MNKFKVGQYVKFLKDAQVFVGFISKLDNDGAHVVNPTGECLYCPYSHLTIITDDTLYKVGDYVQLKNGQMTQCGQVCGVILSTEDCVVVFIRNKAGERFFETADKFAFANKEFEIGQYVYFDAIVPFYGIVVCTRPNILLRDIYGNNFAANEECLTIVKDKTPFEIGDYVQHKESDRDKPTYGRVYFMYFDLDNRLLVSMRSETGNTIVSLACNFTLADDIGQFKVGDIVDYEVNSRSKGLHYINKIDKETNKIHIKDTDGHEHIVSPKNLTTSPKKILSFGIGDIVEWDGTLGQIVSITSGCKEGLCIWVKCFDGQVILLAHSQLSLIKKVHNE